MSKYVLLAALVVSSKCYSGDVRLGIGVGSGDINLSSNFEAPDNTAGDSSLSSSLHLGYVFPNNIITDIGFSTITDDLLFGANDNLHLDSYEILVGYLYKNGAFYVEPKLGYAKWKLELEQGALLNPGPEYKVNNNGSDPFVMLTAGYRFADVFGLSISYKYLDFDYGNAESYLIGFDFAF